MANRKSIGRLFGAVSGVLLITAAAPSQAVEKGDWLLRVGAGHVAPDDSSTAFSGPPPTTIQAAVDSSTSLALTLAYMATENIGVELLAAVPFKLDIMGAGPGGAALGKVAETKQLPPSLMVQYYFNPKGKVRPYVGAGLNYTHFFDVETKGQLTGTIKLDDSTGLALEAGVDVDIGKDMFLNLSVWNIDIETTATSSALGTAEVKIDPWVGFVGLGWRF